MVEVLRVHWTGEMRKFFRIKEVYIPRNLNILNLG